MQLFPDVSITYKINIMGKNIGNSIQRARKEQTFTGKQIFHLS